jgi:hypothetical protein
MWALELKAFEVLDGACLYARGDTALVIIVLTARQRAELACYCIAECADMGA